MISLDSIEQLYPAYLRGFKRSILREYLQYKILEIIYGSAFGPSLNFMGGTALRILYDNRRFSEDLDFDNVGLGENDFAQLAELVKKELTFEGYEVEIKNVFKGAYRCYVRIPKLLNQLGLSDFAEEKILIQLDTEPQLIDYKPKVSLLNKFDVYSWVRSVPEDILLSQKLFCSLNRKRQKGRDYYDIVFLFGRTAPNMNYLRKHLSVDSMQELKSLFLQKSENIDFKELANDVEPFLFKPSDSKKVEQFKNFVATWHVR